MNNNGYINVLEVCLDSPHLFFLFEDKLKCGMQVHF